MATLKGLHNESLDEREWNGMEWSGRKAMND